MYERILYSASRIFSIACEIQYNCENICLLQISSKSFHSNFHFFNNYSKFYIFARFTYL